MLVVKMATDFIGGHFMRRGRPHHRITPPHYHQRTEGPANSQGIREISLPEARNVFYHQSRSTSAAKLHDGSCRPEKSLEKNIQDGRCNNGVDIERCVPLFLATFARFWVKRVLPSDFLLENRNYTCDSTWLV